MAAAVGAPPAPSRLARAADTLVRPAPRTIFAVAVAVAALSLLAAYAGTIDALGAPTSHAQPAHGAYAHLASRLDPLPGAPTLRRALHALGRALGYRLSDTSATPRSLQPAPPPPPGASALTYARAKYAPVEVLVLAEEFDGPLDASFWKHEISMCGYGSA
jgi:hypothetical protein